MFYRSLSCLGFMSVLAATSFTGCAANASDDAAVSEDALGRDELPLVQRRTRIASEIASRHLASLPTAVKDAARCVSVISKDVVGWGLMGAGIGGGLVSCKTSDGSWSAPSYLSLTSVDIGPSIGLLDEDTTFIFTAQTMSAAFRDDFDMQAGVYATAGSAHVELSVDTDGCIVADFAVRRERNCTIAVTDRIGLEAGAHVRAALVRHMQGFFGAGRLGRNSRVYGNGVTVTSILKAPGNRVTSEVIQPWVSTLNDELGTSL